MQWTLDWQHFCSVAGRQALEATLDVVVPAPEACSNDPHLPNSLESVEPGPTP